MLSLILIRHGQTDWNKERLIQGQLDVPLNEIGEQQASALQSALVPLVQESPVPTRAIASDLSRAFHTAELALDGCITIEPELLLREINYGSWQGLDHTRIRENDPEAAQRWWNKPEWDYKPHGGESFGDLHARMRQFHQQRILPLVEEQSQRILIFTHGAAMTAYLNVLFGSNLRFTCNNCSVNEILLQKDSVPRLHFFNVFPHQEPPFFRLHE
ncbi:MAG: histidine phosphatase family protein [Anaerolineae bacterium]|jgi:probable phosphoglycerate mutase|nr:histidine phosphatase family protein [Anaerolineae bacterium]